MSYILRADTKLKGTNQPDQVHYFQARINGSMIFTNKRNRATVFPDRAWPESILASIKKREAKTDFSARSVVYAILRTSDKATIQRPVEKTVIKKTKELDF